MNKTVVVLAEKPSVAKSIAAVLNANERKGGFFIGNGYIVTWCLGHLLEYDNLYAAASFRERADWLVCLNCTRAMSVIYNATMQKGRLEIRCGCPA